MAYMLLIHEPRGQRPARTADEGRAVYQRMVDYANELEAEGVLVATESLRSESLRLEKRHGAARLVDGPFTESKEFIGGFFLINCGTREQALKHAAACPAAEWATIEVRQTGPCYDD
jgi:hypothetical protein